MCGSSFVSFLLLRTITELDKEKGRRYTYSQPKRGPVNKEGFSEPTEVTRTFRSDGGS